MPTSRLLRLPLALLLTTAVLPACARTPDFKKYPLRIKVLASQSGRHTVLLAPLAPIDGDMGAPAISVAFDPPVVYFGVGRANLVSPEDVQGFNFDYDDCDVRVGVTVFQQSFYARWLKPGRRIEVLLAYASPRPGGGAVWYKCAMDVDMQDFAYLLLRNGRMLRASPEVFARKPALLQFIEGNPAYSYAALPRQISTPTAPPAALIHTQ